MTARRWLRVRVAAVPHCWSGASTGLPPSASKKKRANQVAAKMAPALTSGVSSDLHLSLLSARAGGSSIALLGCLVAGCSRHGNPWGCCSPMPMAYKAPWSAGATIQAPGEEKFQARSGLAYSIQLLHGSKVKGRVLPYTKILPRGTLPAALLWSSSLQVVVAGQISRHSGPGAERIDLAMPYYLGKEVHERHSHSPRRRRSYTPQQSGF